MFECILLPLDGSPRSEAVLLGLDAILQRKDAEVVLLRVVPIPDRHRPNREAEERGRAEEYARRLEEQLSERGVRARRVVREGRAAETILDVAAESRAELIAMTSHGRTGAARWTFGSVTEKVIRASPVPILVIRSFGRWTDKPIPTMPPGPPRFKTLLLPVQVPALRITPQVKAFAELFGSNVVVLHVLEREEGGAPDYEARLELDAVVNELSGGGIPVERLLRSGDPAEEIVRAADDLPADLVAMTTHGRAGPSRWALGSVTEKVLRAASAPLLLVRIP